MQDARGQYIGGLDGRRFRAVSRTARRRRSTRCPSEAMPATFALLVDSSQSMSRNIEFVQQRRRPLTESCATIDSVVVAPFRRRHHHGHGSDARSRHDRRRHRRDQADGRHRHSRRADRRRRTLRRRSPAGASSCSSPTATTSAARDRSTRCSTGSKPSRVTVYVIADRRRRRRLARRRDDCCAASPSETGGRAFFPWNETSCRTPTRRSRTTCSTGTG